MTPDSYIITVTQCDGALSHAVVQAEAVRNDGAGASIILHRSLLIYKHADIRSAGVAVAYGPGPGQVSHVVSEPLVTTGAMVRWSNRQAQVLVHESQVWQQAACVRRVQMSSV